MMQTMMLPISSSYAPNFNQSKNVSSLARNEILKSTAIPNNTSFPTFPILKTSCNFFLSTLFKFIDDFVTDFIDKPLSPSQDPRHVLSGSFAPVDEFPPTVCAVVSGSLPNCVDGAYIRNGPNPQFIPARGAYHLFDGDGMLHMIRISAGRAMFCSRYVKTYKYNVEHEFGYQIFPSVFSSFNGLGSSLMRNCLVIARIATGQFDPMANGLGTANTNLALIGGRLFALGESDLPYEIKVTADGDITTIGRHNIFNNTTPFINMTAHPKIDPDTMVTFSMRYSISVPRLTFSEIDPNGKLRRELPIFSMKSTSMIHDFALTKNFIVFPDSQIVLDLMEIARGRCPVRADADKVPRIGILPRDAEDERRLTWIEAPGFHAVHFFNAWEEDDGRIVMVASVIPDRGLEKLDFAGPKMEKIIVNVGDKTLKRQPLSGEILDLGSINPAYAGNKNRYAYAAIMVEPKHMVGVAKIDLLLTPSDSSDHVVASYLYEPNCYGGEPIFVPRNAENTAAEEDDGYLVTYLENVDSGESMFLVLNAKSPTLETVATVKLPARVPAGFHGIFLKENDIKKI